MSLKPPLSLTLLGRFCLCDGDQELRLPAGKAILLLAFLAVSAERTARRDRLAALFWPDADVEQARASLRQTLSRLRALLGSARDALRADNDQIGLVADAWRIDIDALFAADGEDPHQVDPAWAASFLSGVHQRDPAIDAWLESERQRFVQRVRQVFSRAIDRALERADTARALELGLRLTALDPYAEPAHRQLMLAYERNGDRAGALRQYRTLVRLLDEGLGLTPDGDSRALYDRLRRPLQINRMASTQPITTITSASPVAARAAPATRAAVAEALRLVTVLAIQAHDPAPDSLWQERLVSLVGTAGGEVSLSRGMEAVFVFGLDERSSASAAFKVALQVPAIAGAAGALAAGCASGLVGLDQHGDPVGAVVQRAARLALLAEPGDVVIDRAVRSQVAAVAEFDEVRLRDLCGYRVLRVVDAPANTPRTMVGRRAELAQLERLIETVPTDGAAIAVLSGDAGMGKTTLVLEAGRLARQRGYAVLQLAFTSHEATPVGPVERLVRALHDALDEAGVDAGLDELQYSTLQEVLKAPGAGHRRTLRDDEREQRLDLISRLLRVLGEHQAVLLTVEDCHWAPSAAVTGLVDLVDACAGVPLLVVATERREREALGKRLQNRLTEVPVVYQTLTPLSRRDALALMNDHATAPEIRQQLLARAGGHPLFLAQLAETELDAVQPVPVSVVALVQGELDRMVVEARDACLKASVLGASFSRDTLEAVFPEIDTVELSRARLLESWGTRMGFRHALIQEAVYALLTEAELAVLHGRAARHFQARNPGECAHHALRSDDRELAIEAVIAAASWLLADNRTDEAATLIERGLVLEPEGDRRARLLLCRAQVLRDRGAIDEAVAACRYAFDEANEAAIQVQSLIRSAQLLKRRSTHDRAAVQLRDALRIAERNEVPEQLAAELEHECGNNAFMQNNSQRCLQHHQRAHALATRSGDTRLQALALGGLGDAHYAACRVHSAHRNYSACVALADANHHRAVAVAHRCMAAFTGHLQRPCSTAIDQAVAAIDEAHRWKSVQYELLAHLTLAVMYMHAADIEALKGEMNRMDALVSRYGGVRFAPDIACFDVLLCWLSGDQERARQSATDAAERFGNADYMGATFQAMLAAVCYEEPFAIQALERGEALMKEGTLMHNRVDFALFGSACHWRRGDALGACELVRRQQVALGGESVRHLSACLDWMTAASDSTASREALSKTLANESLGILPITHPQSTHAVDSIAARAETCR